MVLSRRFFLQSSLFGDEIQVDAWAKSNQGGVAAQRAEALLHQMHNLYQTTGQENLRPTTGIFNAGRTTLGFFLEHITHFSRADSTFAILKYLVDSYQCMGSIERKDCSNPSRANFAMDGQIAPNS
jgi:hypothetical protein